MTDSMIERVARAIDPEAFDSVYAYDMRDRREKATAAAERAIAAMRGPTQRMVLRGAQLLSRDGWPRAEEAVFNVMIDAALKE